MDDGLWDLHFVFISIQ